MADFVNYKDVPFGDKDYWEVDRDIVRGGVGNEIGWNIEYKSVWDVEGKIAGWRPKPAEKRGLYDLCIDNHIDIPDTISKESPCYKQFMKEKERVRA